MRQDLLNTLRELEQNPDGNAAARKQFRGWLAAREEAPPGRHFELHELKALAGRRAQQGAAFELPEHLLECRACMEVFQVLCEETQTGKSPASAKSGGVQEHKQRLNWRRLPLRQKLIPAAAAALLLSLLFWGYLRPSGIVLESGELRTATQTLRDGPLPARTAMDTLRQTRLRFLDGSNVLLEPGARIRTGRTAGFSNYLEVEAGKAAFDFRNIQSAPAIRAGPLRIAPARARFTLDLNGDMLSIQVDEGEIRVNTAGETITLRENDVWALP
jgi:ferric-dicitrate binding protein FerR (iron transport regulator)